MKTLKNIQLRFVAILTFLALFVGTSVVSAQENQKETAAEQTVSEEPLHSNDQARRNLQH